MAKQRATQSAYEVGVYDDPDAIGAIRFTFTLPRARTERQFSSPGARYIASVQGDGDEPTTVEWIGRPPRGATRDELEGVARRRVQARREWILKLRKLVATVKRWADELDWATKVVEKKMEDAEVGNHRAPALLPQHEAVRLFLEPVARSAPGAEGLVDLYLMPSYDDVASLYYYDDRWNVHYMFQGTPTVGSIHEAEAEPLTKATRGGCSTR